MPLIEYDYRVHDGTTALATFYGASGGTLLQVTSVSGGTNPWLTRPPEGDGVEVDPLTGKTRAGSWSVTMADPITSGSNRLVTATLDDSAAGWRSRWTGRRAMARQRTDGSAWAVLWTGFVQRVVFLSAIEVQVTHTDSPARDRDAAAATQQPGESVSAYVTRWPTRACLAGGPIRGGFLFSQERGGWDVQVAAQSGGSTAFRITGSYSAPSFQRRQGCPVTIANAVNALAYPFYAGSALLGGTFPRLTVETWAVGGSSTFSDPVRLPLDIVTPTLPTGPGPVFGPTTQYLGNADLIVGDIITVSGTVGTVGDVRRLRVLALDPTEALPVYATAHPVTLAETLLTEQGLTVDATSRDAVRDVIGRNARVSLRLDRSVGYWKVLEAVLAPYGVAVRPQSDGSLGFVAVRTTGTALPSTTITLTDIDTTDGAGIYEVAEQTAISRVVWESSLFKPAPPSDDAFPADGVVVRGYRVERESWDALGLDAAKRTWTLDAPPDGMTAMYHLEGQTDTDAGSLGSAIAQEVFLRTRGGRVALGEVLVVRDRPGSSARVGDEVLINFGHLPHRNKRLSDDGTVPPRVATVVRATPVPQGVRLLLEDAGSAAVDSGTAPTITVAQDATYTRACVSVTVTNAATLNTAGRGVRLDVALTTGAAPNAADYADVMAWGAGQVPTGAVRLGPYPPGRTVYVRARAEQPGLRVGAWQTAVSAALASVPAPSAVSLTQSMYGYCDVTWTNGDATAPVMLSVRRTSEASPGRVVAHLPAGSTRQRVYWEAEGDVFGVDGVAYTVEVWHVDVLTGALSASATAAITRTTQVDRVLTAPVCAFITGSGPSAVGQPSGIELAIASQATGEPMVVRRATVASRSSSVRIAVLDADATSFRDYLPADNVTRYYWVEYLRAVVTSGYVGGATPGPLRDQAGTASEPRPTAVAISGVVYSQTSSAFSALGGGGTAVGGSGTAGRLAKWSATTTLADAVVEDDGTHFFPTADATRDLGTASRRWRDGRFSRDVYVGGTLSLGALAVAQRYSLGDTSGIWANNVQTAWRRSGGPVGHMPTGRRLNVNPEFWDDLTGYYTYNNSGGGAVTLTAINSDNAPNASRRVMRISYSVGASSPGYGGFHTFLQGGTAAAVMSSEVNTYRAGERILFRTVARIPTGRTIEFASNATGGNSTYTWLTSQNGTGEWQEYVFLLRVGDDTGGFSSTGFFWINGGANAAFDWDVAVHEVTSLDGSREEFQPSLRIGHSASGFNGESIGFGMLGVAGKALIGQLRVGTQNSVGGRARITAIGSGGSGDGINGNGVEFGHPNTAGYRGTLGALNTNGRNFVALHAEHGTSDNTFRTRGIKGVAFVANLDGGFDVRTFSASADNQGGTTTFSLDDRGAVVVSGTNAAFFANDRSSSGQGVFYRTGGVNRLYDSTYGDVVQWGSAGIVNLLSSRLDLGGVRSLFRNSSYLMLFDPNDRQAIYLGGTADPSNYYDNTGHYFRTRSGGSSGAEIQIGGGVAVEQGIRLWNDSNHTYLNVSNNRTSQSAAGIIIRNPINSAAHGYLHADSSGIGILPPDGNWGLRVTNSSVESVKGFVANNGATLGAGATGRSGTRIPEIYVQSSDPGAVGAGAIWVEI